MLEGAENYRNRLKDEFNERCHRNRRYSLRAFARDIDLLPSRLSDIFQGKQGLSAEMAQKICTHLNWSEKEKRLFIVSVESQHARSQIRRTAALAELKEIESQANIKVIDADLFAIIAQWHHFAILELFATDDFQPSPSWIASRLDLNPIEVERALSRLERVGLLKKQEGGWKAIEGFPITTQDIPSKAIKEFHSQILHRAQTALFFQEVKMRDFSAIHFAVNPSDLPQLKEELREMRRALVKKYNTRPNKTAVYCLGIQLFAATQLKQNEPKICVEES